MYIIYDVIYDKDFLINRNKIKHHLLINRSQLRKHIHLNFHNKKKNKDIFFAKA